MIVDRVNESVTQVCGMDEVPCVAAPHSAVRDVVDMSDRDFMIKCKCVVRHSDCSEVRARRWSPTEAAVATPALEGTQY